MTPYVQDPYSIMDYQFNDPEKIIIQPYFEKTEEKPALEKLEG